MHWQVAQKFFTGGEKRPLSLLEEISAGAVGGFVSAPACTLLELMMIQQQRYAGTLWATPLRIYKVHGVRHGLFRGFVCAAVRESMYTAGLLGIVPVSKKYLQEEFGLNKPVAKVISSLCAGLLCASVTNPADFIKTLMQVRIRCVFQNQAFDFTERLRLYTHVICFNFGYVVCSGTIGRGRLSVSHWEHQLRLQAYVRLASYLGSAWCNSIRSAHFWRPAELTIIASHWPLDTLLIQNVVQYEIRHDPYLYCSSTAIMLTLFTAALYTIKSWSVLFITANFRTLCTPLEPKPNLNRSFARARIPLCFMRIPMALYLHRHWLHSSWYAYGDIRPDVIPGAIWDLGTCLVCNTTALLPKLFGTYVIMIMRTWTQQRTCIPFQRKLLSKLMKDERSNHSNIRKILCTMHTLYEWRGLGLARCLVKSDSVDIL